MHGACVMPLTLELYNHVDMSHVLVWGDHAQMSQHVDVSPPRLVDHGPRSEEWYFHNSLRAESFTRSTVLSIGASPMLIVTIAKEGNGRYWVPDSEPTCRAIVVRSTNR